MRSRWGIGAVVGVAIVSAWACSHDNEPSRSANQAVDRGEYHRELRDERRAIGGGPREDRRFGSTVMKIANARCDREVKCGHVGPNEKFATRDACISKTENDKQGDLNADVCTLGISQQGLHECLRSIRDEDCGNPLDSISRMNACRSGNLCLK